jgi:hypothetical protein
MLRPPKITATLVRERWGLLAGVPAGAPHHDPTGDSDIRI